MRVGWVCVHWGRVTHLAAFRTPLEQVTDPGPSSPDHRHIPNPNSRRRHRCCHPHRMALALPS